MALDPNLESPMNHSQRKSMRKVIPQDKIIWSFKQEGSQEPNKNNYKNLNNDEMQIKDSDKFVTKIINPDVLLKKRLMAKELSNALQQQMEIKKLKKEEERKKRIKDELWYEKKWKAREEISSSEIKTNLEENKIAKQKAPEANIKVELNKEQCDPFVDEQMNKLKSEMEKKEKNFNDELLKLKQVASVNTNRGREADIKLTQLKDHIMQSNGHGFSTSYFSPDHKKDNYYLKNVYDNAKQRNSMGRYGKLYFKEYKKPIKLNSYDNQKITKEQALLGESQMIPWGPNDFFNTMPQSVSSLTSKKVPQERQSRFNRFDDIMKEFLSEK